MDVSVSDPSSETRSPVLKEVRLCIFCSLAVSKPGVMMKIVTMMVFLIVSMIREGVGEGFKIYA